MKADDVLKRFSSDPSLFRQIESELSTASDPIARFMELAREQGMAIDSGELERVLASHSRELDDRALDQVSGGFNPQPDPPGRIAYNYNALIGLLLPAI